MWKILVSGLMAIFVFGSVQANAETQCGFGCFLKKNEKSINAAINYSADVARDIPLPPTQLYGWGVYVLMNADEVYSRSNKNNVSLWASTKAQAVKVAIPTAVDLVAPKFGGSVLDKIKRDTVTAVRDYAWGELFEAGYSEYIKEGGANKAVSVGNLTDSRLREAPKYEKPFSTIENPQQTILGGRKGAEADKFSPDYIEETSKSLVSKDSTKGADSYAGLSYEWDEKSGKNVWKVDGRIVDSSNEVVRKFCSDPSKNCPELGTDSAENPLSTPTKNDVKTLEDVAKAAKSLEMPDLAVVNDYIEQGRSGDVTPSSTTSSLGADADSDTIGGMQSPGGNQVVEPGNSIWHGEGGFQGEEYDDNGLNGTSNIKQFKLWDSDELAPQTSSDIQQKEITERVIDEPVPRGSVYMPEDSYSGGDTYSSSSDPNFNRPTKSRNQNRNNTARNRVTTRCSPGAVDITTPFPVPGRC